MKKIIILIVLLSQFYLSLGQVNSQTKLLINEAIQFEDNRDFENAIKSHQKVLKLNPSGPIAGASLNSISGLFGQLGDSKSQIEWAIKAIEINANDNLAYINLGNGFGLAGDGENARSSFEKATKLDPNDPRGYYGLGMIEEGIGNLNKAIAYYEQSIQHDKNFESGYFNLAMAYANIKDFKKAYKNITKVLELNPNDEDAKSFEKQIKIELSNLD